MIVVFRKKEKKIQGIKIRYSMKHLKSYNEKKLSIPIYHIDYILMNSIDLVKRDIEKGRNVKEGKNHLKILELLKDEWIERKVERNFTYRIVGKIWKELGGKGWLDLTGTQNHLMNNWTRWKEDDIGNLRF
jgi:hypothetical protein